jgi:UMF1 family MFS transporter
MWVLFLLVLCIGKIAFYASLVVYDGMLIDVARDEEMDALSSKGYALGYIGSCIPFAVCLVFIALSDFTDMLPTIFTMQQAVVLSLILVGVWWVVMSLPLFKNYEQVHYRKVSMRNPRKSFLRFISTFKEIAKNKAMFFFMIAFFFYIDGVNTVMEMATAYGESLGIDSVGLLGGLLLTQIVAFPATIFMNKLAFRFGTHRIIVASILGYLAISMFAFFLESVEQFFILAFAVGLFQGTIQALSRSYFGRMVTKDDAGEYFGILDIFGKGSTIIGTALIALLTLFIDDQRVMVYVLIAVFLIGLFMFWLSIREKIYDNPATIKE